MIFKEKIIALPWF